MDKKLKTKIFSGSAAVYVILLGVYNLLVFLIFSDYNDVFWTSYAFGMFAFIVQIVATLLSFKPGTVDAYFYGLPVASFSVYYLCAETVMSFIFMAVKDDVNIKIPIILQTVVLAIFLIVAIIAFMARDAVVATEKEKTGKILEMRSIISEVEIIKDNCEDKDLQETLRKLYETVRFSDPVSTKEVEQVDQMIARKISELRISVDDKQNEETLLLCKDIEKLFAERDKRLANSK